MPPCVRDRVRYLLGLGFDVGTLVQELVNDVE
jgi:hypothetical protein